MRRRRRPSARAAATASAAVAIAAVAVAAGGCGADYPDLFVLTRSGSIPGAKLTLLVNDGGTVRCNGAKAVRLPDPQLLSARDIATRLADDADRGLVLPAAPGSVLRFRLRSQDGTVTFSDTDAARRPELGKAVAFARTVARDVCGLAR
jgi:hypothetical protein